MYHSRFFLGGLALLLTIVFGAAQIPVNNLTDRAVYDTGQRTFSVPATAGYDYTVLLNGDPIPTGTSITVDRMDFYELYIERQLTGGGPLETRVVRFIIISENRGTPERGLIEWTPYPTIPSAAAEVAGARLHLVAPQNFPMGLDIPVVAWVAEESGRERRVNGRVSAAGQEGQGIALRRGIGVGMLPGATTAGVIDFDAQLHSLQTNKQINIESGTAWTTVAGTIASGTEWADNSRIHVTGDITINLGSTLTIQAGTVVLLEPGADIINSGRILIHGTTERPVVFTATGPVAPHQHTHAWGGFIMRGSGAELVANGTILSGAGSATSFSFSPGSSHQSEQALLLVHSGARASLTNCYLINTAGQVGNGYLAQVNLDHCLLQGAITAGEYVGGAVTVNHSAVIGFPEENGEVNPDLAEADYDGIYFTEGTHTLINSLFGFCKDDAIDAGSGGAGSVTVSNCWVESSLHEALAWSGEGRVTRTYDTVLINNGQGIEAGWSDGSGSPLVMADHILSTANSVGARFGDNYDWTYNGSLNVSNSLILHNYRDIWGYNWDDWTYRAGQMNLQDNFVSTVNTNHPNNTLWDPSSHAGALAAFMTTPVDAPVGIGLAVWNRQLAREEITNGVPVRLSSFTTHPVSVGYRVENAGGEALEQGTVDFQPGETLKWIRPMIMGWESQPFVRVDLNNPDRGELTGVTSAYFVAPSTNPPPASTVLIPRGSIWKYLVTPEEIDASWNTLAYTDINWAQGPAQLGYGESDQATTIGFGGNAANKYTTTYFRHTVNVTDPGSRFGSLDLWLLRDDGGVVYLNGTEVFRSPNMPAGPITYDTRTVGSNGENTIDRANFSASVLQEGANLVGVEIHQADPDSSDLSFDLELSGLDFPPSPPLFWVWEDGQLTLIWTDPGFLLDQAGEVDGPWVEVVGASSPWPAAMGGGQTFFRLRKR